MRAATGMRGLVVAGSAVVAIGCKGPYGDYCERHADCTDPAKPFCDTRGEAAESGGHGRTCIAIPFDGAIGPSPDAGGDGGSGLAAPTPVRPATGAFTGTVHVDDNLRPRWIWSAVAGAERYELEVDDDCPAFDFATCPFDSPEIRETQLTATSFRPDEPLPVATEPPVGARYYWRVRACDATGCSAWSPVRYVHVGRERNDYDGDGFADHLIATAPGVAAAGAVYLYLGKPGWTVPSTVQTADAVIVDPRGEAGGGFGAAVAAVGDVNADGFADFVVGASGHDLFAADAGAAYLYLGRALWPATVDAPTTTLANPDAREGAGYGVAVSGGGDLTGDGFSDFAVGASAAANADDAGAAFVYFGRPTWPPNIADADVIARDPSDQPDAAFAAAVACTGDIDRDGLADLAVGAPGASMPQSGEGTVSLYFGRDSFGPLPATLPTADAVIDNPTDELGGRFGSSLSTEGDVDGDAFDDLVVGAEGQSEPESGEGNAFVLLARRPWPPVTEQADVAIDHPGDATAGRFGASVAVGDATGDGVADILVGAPGTAPGGRAYLFAGRAAWPETVIAADVTFDRPAGGSGSSFGRAVSLAGDTNGDGEADAWIGAVVSGPEADEGGAYLWFGTGTWPATVTATQVVFDDPADRAGDHFGAAVY